jgi:hypothetical protein
MKFFVPNYTDDAKAKAAFEATRKFAGETLGWQISERGVFRLKFRAEGGTVTAQVGQDDPTTGEPVFAILESNAYLVCTHNRGVARGEPVLVGRDEVTEVEYFDLS